MENEVLGVVDKRTKATHEPTAFQGGCSGHGFLRVYDEAGNVIETHNHAKGNVVPFRSDQVVSSFTHTVL